MGKFNISKKEPVKENELPFFSVPIADIKLFYKELAKLLEERGEELFFEGGEESSVRELGGE